MRKTEKKQAEDFMGRLAYAYESIENAIRDGNKFMAAQWLEQCREDALRLGKLAEKSEGESCGLIPLVEEYCRLADRIQEQTGRGEGKSTHRLRKRLRRQLTEMETFLKENIGIHKEIVFLPYKASMWDSLESVWKTAAEDPGCDVYVVPIPYYDKNADGSFREGHYEGDLFPDYVPIADYNDYDFKERRPDIIYIHNPYDGCNCATSVHPFFYSANLKQYTDELVYIPYFILQETDPADEQAVESIRHFCLLPGVFRADKVIVQSEAMRQIYINVLVKEIGEKSRGIWEKKIFGLGSPKVDKLVRTKKEELEIPEEWLRIIRKPDGSRKKIIFYNTGVSMLLKYEERMLEKMKNVFRIFKENRQGTALLWRPHPLMKATIESMRPRLWQEYEEITEQYKQEGWGIYDDSAEIVRAIILSDAYYGDPSSVVQLYERTGKPLMIQNMEVGV